MLVRICGRRRHVTLGGSRHTLVCRMYIEYYSQFGINVRRRARASFILHSDQFVCFDQKLWFYTSLGNFLCAKRLLNVRLKFAVFGGSFSVASFQWNLNRHSDEYRIWSTDKYVSKSLPVCLIRKKIVFAFDGNVLLNAGDWKHKYEFHDFSLTTASVAIYIPARSVSHLFSIGNICLSCICKWPSCHHFY